MEKLKFEATDGPGGEEPDFASFSDTAGRMYRLDKEEVRKLIQLWCLDKKGHPDDRAPLRVTVFEDHTSALVLYAADTGNVVLPVLSAPFDLEEVAQAFGNSGITARVSRGHAGRWTRTVLNSRAADKAERRQRERLREATQASLSRGAPSTEQDRGTLIQQKHETDDAVRALSAELTEARRKAAARAQYMDPTQYRKKERRLAELKDRSQWLQTELGKLKTKGQRKECQRFMQAAHKILGKEQLEEVYAAAATAAMDEEV